MGKWHCFKCKVQAEPATLNMEYLGMEFTMDGLKCPKCGAAYIDEATVKEKVIRTQQMIEEKAGETGEV